MSARVTLRVGEDHGDDIKGQLISSVTLRVGEEGVDNLKGESECVSSFSSLSAGSVL